MRPFRESFHVTVDAFTGHPAGVVSTMYSCPVYRVGRSPDPWAWPDWAYATDGTFGNRWDDPQGKVLRDAASCLQRITDGEPVR